MLAVSIYLALRLRRPLFLEGEAGVGKTEIAKVLAAALGTDLIRLPVLRGARRHARGVRVELPAPAARDPAARSAARSIAPRHRQLFTEAFLIKRPLLRALQSTDGRPPVLLIDEIDRADEEFEGYLLELLSDFQVTIPELGTIRADTPPVVVLDIEPHARGPRRVEAAMSVLLDRVSRLRRSCASWPPRCLGASARLAEQVTAFVQELRTVELYKAAGVSETLDWAQALIALDRNELDAETVEQTLGILLKNQEDIHAVRGERLQTILARALMRGTSSSALR